MNSLHRIILALLGTQSTRYVKNPRVVSLFGKKVTNLRAWVCFISFIANGHLALARDIPIFEINSLISFLGYVAGYFFFYLGLIGVGSVVALWLLGWFFSILVQSMLSASPETPFRMTEAQQEKFDDWSINLVLVAGEAYLILGYLFGFFWSLTPIPLW